MSLFRPVHTWSPELVCYWILGLHPLAKQHASRLLHHHTTGAKLLTLTWADLDAMQICGMFDQEVLLTAISLLRDIDQSNKRFMLHPLAERACQSALEALDHIADLEYCTSKEKWHKCQQELYMSCMNSGNLTRTILLNMDKYHVLLSDRPKLAHDLLEGLYSISSAAQDIRLKLKSLGIHVPEMPQELPYNNRNTSFTNCLYTALTSLVTNCTFLTQSALDVSPRGAPSFERITLQPDGDSGMGFSFRETSSGLYIIKRIVPNTPAEKSGRIKSGDEVIEVNDQNVVGWKIKNVVDLIRSNPRCLVMVVRHYPAAMELSKSSPNIQCNLIEKDYSKLRPTSALEPMISQPSLVVSTPKKPPRPLDSVLRERCRSNSELDNHLKTVHTTKRMSQIYNGLPWEEGDPTYNGLSIEDLGFRKSEDHLRLHPVRRHSSSPLPQHNLNTKGWMDKMRLNKRSDTRSPNRNYHQRCNSSSPLPKSYNVTNAAWLESIKYRPSSDKGSTKEGLVIDNLNRSMPDLSISQHPEEQDNTLTKVKEKITPHSVKQEAQEMRSKTLPRRRKPSLDDFEELGEFQNYPMVNKESNYAACVIGGVVHRIPLPTLCKPPPSVSSVCKNSCSDDSNDDQMNSFKCYPSKTNRKRSNKRSSWSLNEKSLTLPKNTRFSMGELDEAGTLRKRKGKKPSRSTSSILGDLSVACKDLYPNACEGWLTKLGGSGLTPRNWRKRWFVLKGYCLYYFKTPQDSIALGVITLPSFNIAAANDIKKKYVFKAYHKNTRTYYFHAESESEMQRWMDKMLLASILYDESDKESGYATGASPITGEFAESTDTLSGQSGIEQSLISPCMSLQSVVSSHASTTAV